MGGDDPESSSQRRTRRRKSNKSDLAAPPQCCQISRFCKFKRRLTAEPLKITKHVGYVLDHSRAEQSKDGVNYRYLKVIHYLKLRDSQNLATVPRHAAGSIQKDFLSSYVILEGLSRFNNAHGGQSHQKFDVQKGI